MKVRRVIMTPSVYSGDPPVTMRCLTEAYNPADRRTAMRLIRSLLLCPARPVAVDPARPVLHRHHRRIRQGFQRRRDSARHGHHHQPADRSAGVGHRRSRGPLHVAAAAAGRVPDRSRPPGLPPRGARERHRAGQHDARRRLHPRSRRPDRCGRSPRRRHPARDDERRRSARWSTTAASSSCR